jgi:hypothetical protein
MKIRLLAEKKPIIVAGKKSRTVAKGKHFHSRKDNQKGVGKNKELQDKNLQI